jgi:hypothetical protein
MIDYALYGVRRFLHPMRRRGFGVHSPFAFDLITGVICQRAEFYAFRDLEPEGSRGREGCRLLFRLAERGGYRRVLLVGQVDGLPARYLSALSTGTRLLGDRAGEVPWELFHAGRVVDGEGVERWLAARDPRHACACVEGIHERRVNRGLWERFREEARVSVDAGRRGVLFFDDRLQGGHYSV